MRDSVRSNRKWWYLPAISMATIGTVAIAVGEVPRTFNTGDTLTAADLNANFAALEQRLAAAEAKGEPFAGTAPAVVGLGNGDGFCGSAPATLNIQSAVSSNRATSNAFGGVVFTNAGALGIALNPMGTGTCMTVCTGPLTFFLKSPAAQVITLHTFLDNAGAIYVDGAAVATGLGTDNTTAVSVPAGKFALSFLACSTDGPSLSLMILDGFLANPAYGLTIDYDRTFHRNNN